MLHCCRSFSVPRYNPISEVCTQFLGLHGLVCTLTCTDNSQTLYRQVCAFFQIMSDQLNLPQVDSNQVVETSVIISGNRMCLSSSRLWILMYMWFFFFFYIYICKRLQTNFYHNVIMGCLFFVVEENNDFNPCWNKQIQHNVEQREALWMLPCTWKLLLKFFFLMYFILLLLLI